MSQKASGLKAPSKIAKPNGSATPRSGLPTPGNKAQGPEGTPVLSPVDDFKIGDRVWVAGTKPGIIAFIGETQFAAGEWAGVVLDQAVGKNDGSVAGVRYFQCEAKKGVFSKVAKLSRTQEPSASPSVGGMSDMSASSSAPIASSTPAKGGIASPVHSVASNGTASHPKMGIKQPAAALNTQSASKKSSLSGSQSNLAKSLSGSSSNLAGHLKVGDRVLVSGSKIGVLKYIGPTEFATGDWAGVELDEPHGKNDGSVAGKRYFSCKPQYGIFAKSNKVTKAGGSTVSTPRRLSTSNRQPGAPSMLRRERSGSQDSISSIGSSMSTSSRSRTTKTTTTARLKPQSVTSTTASLQKALKEKEEHVDQLLIERDIERSELARTSAKCETAENELALLRADHDRLCAENEEIISELKSAVENLEVQNKDLSLRLDEEKRRVEDLQFTVEEATINQDEQEMLAEESVCAVEKMHSVEKQLEEEKSKVVSLEQKLSNIKTQYQDYKAKAKDAEDTSVAYLDQIEELTHKLSMAETKIGSMEAEKQNQGQETSAITEELNAKNQKISELEKTVESKEKALKNYENRLGELDEEALENINRQQRQQDTIDELMQKVAASDAQSNNYRTEMQELKNQCQELQRQLNANEEKTEQLEIEKKQLETQLTEVMKLSGEGSEHLQLMNEQLLEKDRRHQELKAVLADSTREVGKLRRELEAQQQQTEKETEVMVSKHSKDLEAYTQQLQKKDSELSKLQTKIDKLKEKHKEEIDSLSSKQNTEITQLKDKSQSREDQITKLKEELDKSKSGLEASKLEVQDIIFEKEKLEKQLKKLETERESLTFEMDEIEAEREALRTEKQQMMSQQGSASEQMAVLKIEMDTLLAEKQALIKEKETLSQSRSELESLVQVSEEEKQVILEQQTHTAEKLTTLQLELTELGTAFESSKKELETSEEQRSSQTKHIEQLMQKLFYYEDEESGFRTQVESELSAAIQGQQNVEAENERLKMQVASLQSKQEEKEQMESQQENLKLQMEELKASSSQMREEFESEKKTLLMKLDQCKVVIEEKEDEMSLVKTELAHLQGETLALNSFKSTIQGLEVDKNNLQQRVLQLESIIKEGNLNANSNSANLLNKIDSSVTTDKESANETSSDLEEQVKFLNSVIVEQQKKIDDLSKALAGDVNGTADDFSFNDNEVDVKKPPPRLFCDICDMFDQHDTEDCPTQAMSDSESPPASQHHGDRNQQRPYCTICEAFGHTTDECDDEQTF